MYDENWIVKAFFVLVNIGDLRTAVGKFDIGHHPIQQSASEEVRGIGNSEIGLGVASLHEQIEVVSEESVLKRSLINIDFGLFF